MTPMKQQRSFDALTKTWTREMCEDRIRNRLNNRNPEEADAMFLFQIRGEADAFVRKQTAFLLWKAFRQMDMTVRLGRNTFLVYQTGCRDSQEAAGYVEQFEELVRESGGASGQEAGGDFRAGAVIVTRQGSSYEELLQKAGRMLEQTDIINWFRCMVDTDIKLEPEETMVLEEPEEEEDGYQVDAAFIIEVTDDLFSCQNTFMFLEMSLAKLCRYFGVDQAYVAEVSLDRSQYEITCEWNMGKGLVINKNLNVMPYVLASDYQRLFNEKQMLVCSSIKELSEKNRIMAQRQKIRGTRSMMQYAIYENGRYTGYIALCDMDRERRWNDQEMAAFSTVGKIIAAGILKIRMMRYSAHMVYQDMLTKAWNHNQFLAEAGRRFCSEEKKAVVTFDIKNFKVINREFGYGMGNQVLIEISNMLRLFIEEAECFARMEADSFVLMLYYQNIPALERRLVQLVDHVEHLAARVNLPFQVVCMAGVCLVDDRKLTLEDCVERANIARKSIKDFHKGSYAYFDSETARKHEKNKYLTSQMKASLKNGEFIVYYQPKINVVSGEYSGLEALVRWKRPDGEIIGPDDFIPLFEKNRFIAEVDRYVLEQVCREIQRRMREGRKIYPAAVNISRIHIQEKGFLKNLLDICEKYQVPTKFIELEITETAFLDNEKKIVELANQIRDKGFLLSMDDFGTGYSSLSLLKDILVDIIKLDKGFFRKDMSRREKIIISNVINMAKELKIQVIAEGIETKEHEQFLKEVGCDMAQGYLYEKPAPIEELEGKLWKEKAGGFHG